MYHDVSNYQTIVQLIKDIDAQLEENLLVRMEDEFDNSEVTDHKERAKLTKKFNQSVKQTAPVVAEIFPLQIRFTQIKTNLTFLLENAHNRVSYVALAQYLAEYDFLKQQIVKECNKAKNNEVVQAFVERSSVLRVNFFEVLEEALGIMCDSIQLRMTNNPEQYIDLDMNEDSRIDMEEIKAVYKHALKKFKKNHEDSKLMRGVTT